MRKVQQMHNSFFRGAFENMINTVNTTKANGTKFLKKGGKGLR